MQNVSNSDATKFINSFVEAACWAESVVLEQGEDIDVAVDDCELAPEARAALRRLAVAFLPKFAALIPSDVPRWAVCWNKIAYDAWLTMNNHGAGFWDRDARTYFHGEEYTAQADAFLSDADELAQANEMPGYFYSVGRAPDGTIIADFAA